jgi:transposase InsO family protein
VRLLHERTHASLGVLARLARKVAIGIPATHFEAERGGLFCWPCTLGGARMAEHPPSQSRATRPMERVATDVFGKFVRSVDREEYLLLIVDEFSGFGHAAFLRSKAEAPGEIVLGLQQLSTLAGGATVAFFRSDGAPELWTSDVRDYLGSVGARREFSAPGTPQQNGLAERYGQTIMQRTRSFMAASGIGSTYWPYAAAQAVRVTNMLPSRGRDELPWKAFRGVDPPVRSLRAFGCKVRVALQPMQRERGEKLSGRNRAAVGVYLGDARAWGSGGHVVLLADNHITMTPNVVFDETTFPLRMTDADEYARLRAAAARSGPFEVAAVQQQQQQQRRRRLTRRDEENAAADNVEINGCMAREVWRPDVLPPGKRALNTYFIRTVKPNGTTKSRVVADGSRQVDGLDFSGCSAATVHAPVVRCALAKAARHRQVALHLDYSQAFLNAPLEEDVWVYNPPGFPISPTGVLKLQRALYGLRQAPRAWERRLAAALCGIGLQRAPSEAGLFTRGEGDNALIVVVYVDDLLVVGPEAAAHALAGELLELFPGRLLGQVERFLGMSIRRDATGSFFVNEAERIDAMVARFCDGAPPAHNSPLTATVFAPSEPIAVNSDEHNRYRSLVGSIQYVANTARPDVAFAAGYLGRFSSAPLQGHWRAGLRVLAYLASTREMGLHFDAAAPFQLRGYVDADFAGCLVTRRSTTGWVLTLGGAPVAWSSKRQSTVALSTTNAEYVAAAMAAAEAAALTVVLLQMGTMVPTPVPMLIDNDAARLCIAERGANRRLRHIEVVHHFVRERQERGEVQFERVSSSANAADMLTKVLNHIMHRRCCQTLRLC